MEKEFVQVLLLPGVMQPLVHLWSFFSLLFKVSNFLFKPRCLRRRWKVGFITSKQPSPLFCLLPSARWLLDLVKDDVLGQLTLNLLRQLGDQFPCLRANRFSWGQPHKWLLNLVKDVLGQLTLSLCKTIRRSVPIPTSASLERSLINWLSSSVSWVLWEDAPPSSCPCCSAVMMPSPTSNFFSKTRYSRRIERFINDVVQLPLQVCQYLSYSMLSCSFASLPRLCELLTWLRMLTKHGNCLLQRNSGKFQT